MILASLDDVIREIITLSQLLQLPPQHLVSLYQSRLGNTDEELCLLFIIIVAGSTIGGSSDDVTTVNTNNNVNVIITHQSVNSEITNRYGLPIITINTDRKLATITLLPVITISALLTDLDDSHFVFVDKIKLEEVD